MSAIPGVTCYINLKSESEQITKKQQQAGNEQLLRHVIELQRVK